MLTEPAWGGGVLLVHYIRLPLVYSARWTTAGIHILLFLPRQSFVPVFRSSLSEDIHFLQRLGNIMFYGIMVYHEIVEFNLYYDELCDK